ncbi:MAG: type II toxin-antitoxin system PemK/MazF family toxin [Variibacter sp.]
MKRGEVWTAAGSGYAGKPRPIIIIQDDRFDATKSVTVCGLTTTDVDAPLGRIKMQPSAENGLEQTSWMMVDKVFTVRRGQLGKKLGTVSPAEIQELNRALIVFLGLSG